MRLTSRRDVLRAGSLVLGSALGNSVLPRLSVAQQEPAQPVRGVECVTTTAASPWQKAAVTAPRFRWDSLNLNVDASATAQTIDGFGCCFNDLGWTSLGRLSDADREAVMLELFDPVAGARFTLCRMPVGANDFSTEAYSYDETAGDFDLKHFSIEHDKATLVPFIHAAQKHQPKLKLWASPWTPPSWMKRNNFYAEAPARRGWKDNGIRPDQVGHEGEDMFILDEPHLAAYARYFGKFIDAYRAQGIPIGMVMPQNEFNSAQNFPSCTWTPEGLAKFLRHLGPEMTKREVAVFFGTLERGNPALLEKVMADPGAAKYITGFGAQWAGKNSLPALQREYPKLKIYQSEQECGDGTNTWEYTAYCWQLMKHYLRSGANAYMYWNLSLEQGVPSTWGWKQNSLVSVDPQAKTFRYNSDYYLMKHLSHFVSPGAKRLDTSGTCDDALAFVNPDGMQVFLLRNAAAHAQTVDITSGKHSVSVPLAADSISTVMMQNA